MYSQEKKDLSDMAYIGGIPSSVFNSELCERLPVETKSGKTLTVTKRKKLIEILDEETLTHVTTILHPDGFITATVRTKLPGTNFRHDDLYAAKTLHEEIQYLKNQGNEISGFRAEWVDDPTLGDNTQVFLSELGKKGITFSDLLDPSKRSAIEKDLFRAASHTWTGELAAAEGFPWVQRISIDNGKIIVVEFVPQPVQTPEKRDLLRVLLKKVRTYV